MPNQYDQRASARRQALLALLSGTVAEPAAGLAGLYGLVTGGAAKGAHNVEATRGALTYQPRDPSALQALGRAVEPVTGRLQKLRDYLGDEALAHTGSPGAATAAYMVPDTLLTLLGARGAGVKGPKLAQMLERTEGPTMGSPVSQIGAIRAYHGSPHDFDRFSMDHIGTGEGAQAYGHGLYFAGSKEVAENYRQALTRADGAKAISDGKFGDPQSIASLLNGREEFLKVLTKRRDAATNDAERAAAQRQIVAIRKEIREIRDSGGNTYEVELAPDDADLLDWDAPLTPELVQKVQQVAPGYMSGGMPNGISQSDAYHFLAERLGDAGASKFLREQGIPGIRYLDGGSRAAGDGSRNYVMFDDSLIKIKGKE